MSKKNDERKVIKVKLKKIMYDNFKYDYLFDCIKRTNYLITNGLK